MSQSLNLFLKQTLQTIGVLMLILIIGLCVDSEYVSTYLYSEAQWINNVFVVILFIFLFFKSPSRTKEQLIYAVLIAIIGEYLFSIVLGMYTYRLHNIPHYIPVGHAIVFLYIYNFCKKSAIRAHRTIVEKTLTIAIIITSLFFLIFKHDVFGFILTIFMFYSLRKHPKERLFYLSMYSIIVFLELIGTYLNCWEWPLIAFDKFNYLPSANPPIGISFFYFGLDRGTMSIYKRRHKTTWQRFKRLRQVAA